MCQHLEDFFENLTFSSEFHQFQWVGSFPLALSFFFIFAKGRSCFLSFWVFRAMLTVAVQEEGKCKENPHCPRSLSNEIILLMRFLKEQPELEPCIKVSTGSHMRWPLLAVNPLAPLWSLPFYHLWSSRGQRTPGFMSTKVLLLQIVNPRPVCSNDFSAVHSFLTFLPYSLNVFIYWG